MAVSPDGSHIYITNIAASTVTVMNATGPNAGTVGETVAIPKNAIFGGGGPLRIAFSPNGDHAYLVDQTGIFTELSFADTDTNL
jgi:DNA-binding beta-propeller fold protein YncE